MITKTEIKKSSVGNKNGFCFCVYWDNKQYPNFVSSLVKTERGAKNNLNKYLKTGKFSLYGNAE